MLNVHPGGASVGPCPIPCSGFAGRPALYSVRSVMMILKPSCTCSAVKYVSTRGGSSNDGAMYSPNKVLSGATVNGLPWAC
eukprot:8199169-Ditylum_brightwellii.AAC.1